MMKARTVNGIFDVFSKPQIANHGLLAEFVSYTQQMFEIRIIIYERDSSGYFGTASSTDDHTDGSSISIGHNGRCHGRKWSLTRFDIIHLAGWHPEIVGDIGRREIGHLVVYNNTCLLGSETCSEANRY